MDIEQFKMIMDALGAAGEGAFFIAVLYIGKSYFTSVMVGLAMVGVVWLITRTVRECDADVRFHEELRKELGGGGYGPLHVTQKARVLEIVRNSVNQQVTDDPPRCP